MEISVPRTQAPVVTEIVNPNDGTAPTYNGYTGAGVIIGIIDTGLDLTHADFHTAVAPSTRVLYLWDQTTNLGLPPPTGYNYGSEVNQAQINANTSISNDHNGSGTHLAGIAAGNGRATANGKNAYRYIGMAPEADLIIVNTGYIDARVVDGATWIFQKAAALGKPCVIFVPSTPSIDVSADHSNQKGPHDGSSTLDVALSALCGLGKIIVCPVGDDGLQPIHSKIDLVAGGSGTLNWTIPSYSVSTGERLDVQAWHNLTASFEVRLTTPSGIQSAWVQPGTTTGIVDTADGAYVVENAYSGTTTKAKQILATAYWRGGAFPRPKIGAWKLEVNRLGPATTGRLDAWIANWKFGSGGVYPAFTTNIDTSMTVASPATGERIIAVSAYTNRSTWFQPNGQLSFYSENPTPGTIYSKSNRGPRRDLVQCPHVAAPGEGIISSLASFVSGQAGNLKADDGLHWILRSSRQAAAHVVGAIALRMQQSPTLSPETAKDYLEVSAHTDVQTGAVPNNLWGYGKLICNIADPPAGPGGGKLPRSFTEV